jgi:hypothetical protein
MDNVLMVLFGAVGMGYLIVKYIEGGFSKDNTVPKQPDEYNERNLPKGCQLIQISDNYIFKVEDKFVGMNHKDYYLWSDSSYFQQYCMTKDKEYAIKRGIETFTFFKALGKI